MSVSAFPLQWPPGRERTPTGRRRGAAFSKKVVRSSGEHSYRATAGLTIADALDRLQKELDRLGARYLTVSSNVEPRLDGRPKSSTLAPSDPGVAVYFRLGDVAHCLPCDTFRDLAQNIAAVAAHIEATRAIERHGVASVREMFSGFAALPAPKKWFEVLGISESSNATVIIAAYRALAAKRHPDKPGGSHDAMSELNKARDEGLKRVGQ